MHNSKYTDSQCLPGLVTSFESRVFPAKSTVEVAETSFPMCTFLSSLIPHCSSFRSVKVLVLLRAAAMHRMKVNCIPYQGCRKL